MVPRVCGGGGACAHAHSSTHTRLGGHQPLALLPSPQKQGRRVAEEAGAEAWAAQLEYHGQVHTRPHRQELPPQVRGWASFSMSLVVVEVGSFCWSLLHAPQQQTSSREAGRLVGAGDRGGASFCSILADFNLLLIERLWIAVRKKSRGLLSAHHSQAR